MPKPGTEQFEAACRAYERYVAVLGEFVETMVTVGAAVKNVEPFAIFAEVIAAYEFGGELQKAANKDFDLRTAAGIKVQVKSLRVSSSCPEANGLDWRACTREYWLEGKKVVYGDRIDADRLAIVVFLDYRPYSLIDFPIGESVKFPAAKVLGLGFDHVRKLVEGRLSTEGTGVRVIDLQARFPTRLGDTPPAPPAAGE